MGVSRRARNRVTTLTALVAIGAVLVFARKAVLVAQQVEGIALRPDESAAAAEPAKGGEESGLGDENEAHAEAVDVTLPVVEVIEGLGDQGDTYVILPTVKRAAAPDSARLLRQAPGANFSFNGPLANLVQYRGMSAHRVNVLVDGVAVPPSCPNRMDPPLHYAPAFRLETLEVVRGIAPVSFGVETIGGAVRAKSRTSEFGSGDELEFHGDVATGARSVDRSFFGGGLLSGGNARHRAHVIGSYELGDDYIVNTVRVTPTEYERYNYGGGYGAKLGVHELAFDYRHDRADDVGTPALPMDARLTDSDILRGEYKADFDVLRLEGRVSGVAVDHRMDNFGMRQPPPNPGRYRSSDATSRALGYRLATAIPIAWSELALGADGALGLQNADIVNPDNPAFYIDNFNDAERYLFGFFAEWTAEPIEDWRFELGLRYNRVETDAGRVEAITPGAPGSGPQILRDRFNAASREQSDDNTDWVVKVTHAVLPDVDVHLAGGRKSRSPVFFERYAWLPLQASGGLADGNNYVGDIGLKPEVAHEVELGVDWRNDSHYFTPRVFYRYVDDYIQGVPSTDPVVIAVSTAGGDPTPLEWANVEARLYGVDAGFGVEFIEHWHVDGTVGYVRGERVDISDDLYRIAPLTATLALSHRRETWSASVEGVFAGPQCFVSQTNNEAESDGNAVMNVYFWRELLEGLDLVLGVENVFDSEIQEHLSGVNRAAGGDVPVRERLPSLGRNLFVMLSYNW